MLCIVWNDFMFFFLKVTLRHPLTIQLECSIVNAARTNAIYQIPFNYGSIANFFLQCNICNTFFQGNISNPTQIYVVLYNLCNFTLLMSSDCILCRNESQGTLVYLMAWKHKRPNSCYLNDRLLICAATFWIKMNSTQLFTCSGTTWICMN